MPGDVDYEAMVKVGWEIEPKLGANGTWWKQYKTIEVPLRIALSGEQRGVAFRIGA